MLFVVEIDSSSEPVPLRGHDPGQGRGSRATVPRAAVYGKEVSWNNFFFSFDICYSRNITFHLVIGTNALLTDFLKKDNCKIKIKVRINKLFRRRTAAVCPGRT